MKAKSIVFYAVVMLLCTPIVVGGASVTVTPMESTFDLRASQHLVRNITITNNENKRIEIYVSTGPNYEGINITYSEELPLVLEAHETMILKMYINTSMRLMPGEYLLKTILYNVKEVEPEPEPKKSKKSSSDEGYVPQYFEDDQDGDSEPSDYLDEQDKFVWPPYFEEDEVEASLPWFAIPVGVLIASLCISLVILAIFYSRRKKNENKK